MTQYPTYFFCLPLLALLTLSACRQSQDDARRERVELGQRAIEEVDAGPSAETTEPLLPPEVLGSALPKLRRSSRLKWRNIVRQPAGHYSAQLVSRETRQVVVRFAIEDLSTNPRRLNQLKEGGKEVQKRPGEVQPDTRVCALALERVEICVTGPHGHASQEVLDKWIAEVEFRRLEKTFGEHQEALKADKAKRALKGAKAGDK